jgi:hypothetical protein
VFCSVFLCFQRWKGGWTHSRAQLLSCNGGPLFLLHHHAPSQPRSRSLKQRPRLHHPHVTMTMTMTMAGRTKRRRTGRSPPPLVRSSTPLPFSCHYPAPPHTGYIFTMTVAIEPPPSQSIECQAKFDQCLLSADGARAAVAVAAGAAPGEEDASDHVITLEVACPADGVAGEAISVQHAEDDGTVHEFEIEIPEGVEPGEMFEVKLAR